jgi:hypothetical protein
VFKDHFIILRDDVVDDVSDWGNQAGIAQKLVRFAAKKNRGRTPDRDPGESVPGRDFLEDTLTGVPYPHASRARRLLS